MCGINFDVIIPEYLRPIIARVGRHQFKSDEDARWRIQIKPLRETNVGVASHAGVFRGARISSLPTNACSTEDNIPFPLLHSRGK